MHLQWNQSFEIRCFRPGFVPADLLALETLLIVGTRASGPGKHSAQRRQTKTFESDDPWQTSKQETGALGIRTYSSKHVQMEF